MTHCERVLEVLSDGEPHSHHELYALNVIAHSRVADLRRRGYVIEHWRDGDTSYYQLVASLGQDPPDGGTSPSEGEQILSPSLDEATSSLDSVPERLRSRIDEQGDGCWLWTGSKNEKGYGLTKNEQRQTRRAHRVIYELLRGPIPEGLTLDHLCRVRHCVNPDHLEAVTNRENILRGQSPSAGHAKKARCPRGHLYDAVEQTANGQRRFCSECRRASHRRSWHRRKERVNAARRSSGEPTSDLGPDGAPPEQLTLDEVAA